MNIRKNDSHHLLPQSLPPKTRAVIFCMGFRDEMKPLLNYRPSPLLNVADKPIIFHVIEFLVRQGIHHFDLILHHFPEQIEEKLENGTRWGINIKYHLAKNPTAPLAAILPTVKSWNAETILFGVGDSIPFLSILHSKPPLPVFYNDSSFKWTGWAMFTKDQLGQISSHTPYAHIPSKIKSYSVVEVKPFLCATNYHELKESNKKFLHQKDSAFLFPTSLKNVEPGVWISRAVTIEPGVNFIPPLLIGENTQIKTGACIGPNAIIENHCIIDNNSIVENSIICQNSYVGESLEVENCIVDRNSLINLSFGTHLNIKEEFLISESIPPSISQITQTVLERFLGLLIFAFMLPVYLLMKVLGAVKTETRILIPTVEDNDRWKEFDLYFVQNPTDNKTYSLLKYLSWVPSLLNVIKGNISFVGVKIRTLEETKQLPVEWQNLYLKSKSGMITLSDILYGDNPTEDEEYASEAYYITRKNLFFDLKLICKWLLKKAIG